VKFCEAHSAGKMKSAAYYLFGNSLIYFFFYSLIVFVRIGPISVTVCTVHLCTLCDFFFVFFLSLFSRSNFVANKLHAIKMKLFIVYI